MLTFAVAVAAASLLGSLHCVGMCGPFALWATQGGRSFATVSSYHLGRLTTYLSAGLAAGVIGTAVTIGGEVAGMQSLAAKMAGLLLVVLGLGRLLSLSTRLKGSTVVLARRLWRSEPSAGPAPSIIAGWIQSARPLVANRGDFARAYFGGLLTTWLPCGWLYLFVLVAAGTGDVILALTTMTAFWIGTLPALTALTLGAKTVIPKFRRAVPIVAGLFMIATGLYTATGRASADLSSIVPPLLGPQPQVTEVMELTDSPLPCCLPES